jgi:2-iminoacetate synthase
MPLFVLPPLADFVALVQATDPDAPYRLPLLDQAAPLLYGDVAMPAEQAETLADRFERWRYQLLNKRDGRVSGGARDLADALDLAASLARGRLRPPKRPRTALAPPEAGADVEACLDPGLPLADTIRRAAELTAQHFPGARGGRRMMLYAPLYLSSYCINHCLYCSFRFPHPLQREHLGGAEVLAQADLLGTRGFKHLLLVAGDFPRMTSTSYFTGIIAALVGRGFTVAIEVAPQSTLSYAQLARAGACGVTLYQETYQEELYRRYHPLGPKVWFDWRLEGPERAAEAGISRLGLGILLGLADPRLDLRALIAHGHYLQGRFPEVKLAFSLPRIHEAPEGFESPHPVDDGTFLRLYCALRVAFPAADLVLSTREEPSLRDRLAQVCITQMSAGSCTSPGGYGARETDPRDRQQFPVADHRSPAEVAGWLASAGFDVRWELSGPTATFARDPD